MARELPRILVVDDEPDICWALENILCPAGFTVTTITTGAEVLNLVAQERYAAIFLDAKLPDVNGLELASRIRDRSPRTSVVLISGYYYEEDDVIIEGIEEDLFIGLVAKPFDLEEVRRMAHRAVERAKGEGDVASSHSAGG